MPIAHGYWLDDKTFLCPAVDKDGTMYWCKLTTYTPRDENGNITYDHLSGKYFDMEIVDPEHFEWKGQILRLTIEGKD